MYQDDSYEMMLISDFRGGLNNTDPPISLLPNQFTAFQDWQFSRTGVLEMRPPFRPKNLFGDLTVPALRLPTTSFALTTATGDSPNTFTLFYGENTTGALLYDISETDLKTALASLFDVWPDFVTVLRTEDNGQYGYSITVKKDIAELTVTSDGCTASVGTLTVSFAYGTDILDYQVLPCSIASWNVEGQMHLVAMKANDERTYVCAFHAKNGWVPVWSKPTNDVLSVSMVPYRLNQALDILIFPVGTTSFVEAQRWAVLNGVPTTTPLGLTPPSSTDFTVEYTQQDEGDMSLTAGKKLYYRFAYYYDNLNATQYGESSTESIDSGSVFTASSDDSSASVKLTFTPALSGDYKRMPRAGIVYVRIYRSRSVNGPYKYIGQTAVTYGGPSTDDQIAVFIDNVPFDFEGHEEPVGNNNPNNSERPLSVLRACLAGGSVAGFDGRVAGKFVYSVPGQPDAWDPLNYDYLDGDGMSVVEFNRKIYLFTSKAVYEKTSIDSPAYRICNIGCVDGRTVQNVGRGICWMGSDSIYFADFVNQYGSKGDFPLEIGHNISRSVLQRDASIAASSAFCQQRYYLVFTQKNNSAPSTFVYDIDFNCWVELSWYHHCVASHLDRLYTVGKTVVSDQEMFFVYEHGYTSTTALDYVGQDFHDYRSIEMVEGVPVYAQPSGVSCFIQRSGIRLGGDCRQAIISSITLATQSSGFVMDATVSAEDDAYHSQLTITGSNISDMQTEFGTAYDIALYDSDTHRYCALYYGRTYTHKKLPRAMKSYEFTITLQTQHPRDLRLLIFGFYYKLLPFAA